MAGPFYCNPSAGGTDSGTQANPWLSAQAMFDGFTGAGEICYCTGTDTLAASPTITTAGTEASPIQVIGTDASWNDTGTDYFTFDGNSAATNALDRNGKLGYIFKNCKFKNATGDGMATSAASYVVSLINCEISGNGGAGLTETGAYNFYHRVRIFDNTSYGMQIGNINIFITNSMFYGNGGYGFLATTGTPLLLNNWAWDNSNDNFYVQNNASVIGNISDDSTSDGLRTNGRNLLAYNLLTNNGAYGITQDNASLNDFSIMNGFRLNTTAEVNDATRFIMAKANISVSSDPYTNQAGRDYTLDPTDTSWVGVEIVGDTNNSAFVTTGIPPEYVAASGGGRQPRLRINGN